MPQSRTLKPRIQTFDGLDDMEVLHTRISGTRFPLHIHDSYVIQVILSGTDTCDVTGLKAESGDVFVHSPGAAHTGGPTANSALEYGALYPSPNLVNHFVGAARDETFESGSHVVRCPRLRSRIESFLECLDRPLSSTETDGRLGELFKLTVDTLAQAEAVEQAPNRLVSPMIQTCQEHLREYCTRDVPIAELVDITGLNGSYLIRAFKQSYGITPRQFLICQRVAAAKRLLVRGGAIAEVAIDAGFVDQSHMNRCFRRVSGFTPGQFVAERRSRY